MECPGKGAKSESCGGLNSMTIYAAGSGLEDDNGNPLETCDNPVRVGNVT